MSKKLICPECGKQEVEEMNACGASNYFCNHCKRLISRSRIIYPENNQKNEENH
ncbi:YfgJ family double zinc ribbon protein [Clostridium sp.]|uniref:YfgJ family double zinc ribbon protein n=1 Tax=Clostridium sp. TaxID=1506 RepID=UPI003F36AC7F